MHDHPAAGRAWFFTALDDDTAEAARNAFLEVSGHRAENVLQGVPTRFRFEELPLPARQRLDALLAEAATRGHVYKYESGKWQHQAVEGSSLGEGVAVAGYFAFVIALLIVLAVGSITVVRWLL